MLPCIHPGGIRPSILISDVTTKTASETVQAPATATANPSLAISVTITVSSLILPYIQFDQICQNKTS